MQNSTRIARILAIFNLVLAGIIALPREIASRFACVFFAIFLVTTISACGGGGGGSAQAPISMTDNGNTNQPGTGNNPNTNPPGDSADYTPPDFWAGGRHMNSLHVFRTIRQPGALPDIIRQGLLLATVNATLTATPVTGTPFRGGGTDLGMVETEYTDPSHPTNATLGYLYSLDYLHLMNWINEGHSPQKTHRDRNTGGNWSRLSDNQVTVLVQNEATATYTLEGDATLNREAMGEQNIRFYPDGTLQYTFGRNIPTYSLEISALPSDAIDDFGPNGMVLADGSIRAVQSNDRFILRMERQIGSGIGTGISVTGTATGVFSDLDFTDYDSIATRGTPSPIGGSLIQFYSSQTDGSVTPEELLIYILPNEEIIDRFGRTRDYFTDGSSSYLEALIYGKR